MKDVELNKMKKILTIVGPTATGKTDLAMRIAKQINGELVSCDSRQVYVGLDQISGKIPDAKSIIKQPGCWLADGVPIWMVDMCEVSKIYSVSDYINDVNKVLVDIWSRGRLPIIVGGTGYYLRGLLDGYETVGVPRNEKLREELDTANLDELQSMLSKLSPDKWLSLNNSDRNNKVRLIRAIEVGQYHNQVGEISERTPLLADLDILKIGLDISVDDLKKKVVKRLEQRLEDGMIKEAQILIDQGISTDRMERLGLECRYLARYLNKKLTLDQMKEELAMRIWQYAKRQRTWFRTDKNIQWFDVGDKNWVSKVEKTVLDWYNKVDGKTN